MSEEPKEKKGVGLRVFGISLILLAALNMMFTWRGGFTMSPFYPVLMAVGTGLFILGTLKGK